MNALPHILVVDDDPQICELLSDFLSRQNYRVSTALNGIEMKRVLKRRHVDLIVLDIMLPGDDGLELCRQLRAESAIPIIMLSAAGAETDRVVGLEFGADDYLPKPFSPRELHARIKALLRRVSGRLAKTGLTKSGKTGAAPLPALPTLRFANWILDQNRRRLVEADGLVVPLSTAEYDLLTAFIQNPKRVLNRDQLLDITQGREASAFDRTIDVQVGRLRKKLEKDPKNPRIIVTVRGGGYQFTPDVEHD